MGSSVVSNRNQEVVEFFYTEGGSIAQEMICESAAIHVGICLIFLPTLYGRKCSYITVAAIIRRTFDENHKFLFI